MPYKQHNFISVIPRKLNNPNQLTLRLTTRRPAKIIKLPPAPTYEDPEFVHQAIERVRLENRNTRRNSIKFYKQSIDSDITLHQNVRRHGLVL